MSLELLDKTRKINKLLHNNATTHFVFSDICSVMSETMDSNILVLSHKGKILGMGEFYPGREEDLWSKAEVGIFIDPAINERLLDIRSTYENVNPATLGIAGDYEKYNIIITPIEIAGERIGTILGYRMNSPYEIDDIIVMEYGTSVVGLELLRSLSEENAEILRKHQMFESAMSSLSDTEKEAVKYMMKELDVGEGILVAGKIAEEAGTTRSIVVNAMRKLESAGILETRSSGMKGTYIKVLNEFMHNSFDNNEENQ